MAELGQLNAARRDAAGARALFQQVIDARHPKWSAAATLGLAGLLERLDDREAAEALYRQAIQAGNPDWSGQVSFALGELLKRKGDAAGAKAAWQPVIDSADPEWAGPAFTHLVNLLRDNHDIDGLRAAYPVAAARHNPDALYALGVLGQELDDLGDTDGAHAAWQQAIDAGYEFAEDLRDRISPPEPEDEPDDDAVPDDLPPQFDPANLIRAGVDVLDHGLPDLPGTLSYKMAIPVAYWKAEQCAVLLVLRFSRHGRGTPVPMVMQVVYSHTGDGWILPRYVFGSGFYHDPIARPRDRREMDGRSMVGGGDLQGPAGHARLSGIHCHRPGSTRSQVPRSHPGRQCRAAMDLEFVAGLALQLCDLLHQIALKQNRVVPLHSIQGGGHDVLGQGVQAGCTRVVGVSDLRPVHREELATTESARS